MTRPPALVLDTNAVLDWLLFRDLAADAFGAAISEHRVVWLASRAMRREFDDVLGRARLTEWQTDAEHCLRLWDAHARMTDSEPPASSLRCRDPDDQVFVDLALQHGCRWLITRDRAVLDLRSSARALGLTIVTPSAFADDAARMGAHFTTSGP